MKTQFELWPAGIGLMFLAFITVMLSMVIIATRTFEGPEDDHYYENGLNYGDELRREQRQGRLGWHVEVAYAQGQLDVQVKDAHGAPVGGAAATVRTTRPATRTDDRAWSLPELSPGRYGRELSLRPGEWDFRVDVRRGEDDYRKRTRAIQP